MIFRLVLAVLMLCAAPVWAQDIYPAGPSGGGVPVGGSCSTTNAMAKFTSSTTLGCSAVIDASGALSGITTLSLSGQLTSTLATGTAPFAISSATLVPTLYVARAALADTTTTNANLTGPITSVGNATSIASQTGTGTKFVVDTSPTLVTPNIGVATATSVTTPIVATSASDLSITPSTNIASFVNGTNAQRVNVYGTFTSSTSFESMDLEYNGSLSAFGLFARKGSGGGSDRPIYFANETNQAINFRTNGTTRGGVAAVGGLLLNNPDANASQITLSGYGLTGSSTTSQFTASGTLNTSGVAHVNDWSIINTASGAGSTGFRIRAGAAGTTAVFSVGVAGAVFANLLTAASGTPNSLCINSATKEITENAALTCTVSSRRFKNSIHDQDVAGPILASLTPREFRMNDSPAWRVGFIAEEVERIDPRLVNYDPQGRPHSVRYEDITSILTKGIQELDARVRALEAK